MMELVVIQKQDLYENIRKIIQEELGKMEPPQEKGELISSEEACKLLGVSKPTLHSWKVRGDIPFYRMGSKVFFKRHEIMSSLKAGGLKKYRHGPY